MKNLIDKLLELPIRVFAIAGLFAGLIFVFVYEYHAKWQDSYEKVCVKQGKRIVDEAHKTVFFGKVRTYTHAYHAYLTTASINDQIIETYGLKKYTLSWTEEREEEFCEAYVWAKKEKK